MRKGMEKGVEIVIAIVVLMILAVTVVMFFTSNLSKGQKSSEGTINQSDNSIKYSLCKLKCDDCIREYGGACPSSEWQVYRPDSGGQNSCADLLSC